MGTLGGAWGAQAGFVEQVDSPATFEVVVEAGPLSLDLSWNAVAGAVKYVVCCGLSADQLLPVGETRETGYTIRSLRAGVQYFVQVLAYFAPQKSIASVTDDGGEMIETQLLPFVPATAQVITVQFADLTDPNSCTLAGFQQGQTTPVAVIISAAPGVQASVDFQTLDGPALSGCGLPGAVAGVDYIATSGTLTFPAGDSSPQSIPVSAEFGPGGVFRILLSNPVNCGIGSGNPLYGSIFGV